MITDDPDTPGNGKWEVNLAFSLERNLSQRTFHAPLLDMNYGVGDQIQLKWEVPWVLIQSGEDPSKNGLGDSLIGMKWRFLNEKGGRPAISVYPQLTFNNPTSSARRGIVDSGASLFLPLEIKRTFGQVAIGGEIGGVVRGCKVEQWTAGLVVGFDANERLKLLAELRATSSADLRDAGLLLNVGMRARVNRVTDLLLSVGASPDTHPVESLALRCFVGLQIRR